MLSDNGAVEVIVEVMVIHMALHMALNQIAAIVITTLFPGKSKNSI